MQRILQVASGRRQEGESMFCHPSCIAASPVRWEGPATSHQLHIRQHVVEAEAAKVKYWHQVTAGCCCCCCCFSRSSWGAGKLHSGCCNWQAASWCAGRSCLWATCKSKRTDHSVACSSHVQDPTGQKQDCAPRHACMATWTPSTGYTLQGLRCRIAAAHLPPVFA